MDALVTTILLGIMQGGLYTLVGLGVTLTFGVTHILNFAHGEFITVGAYAFVLFAGAVGAGLALPLALLVAGGIAALLYVVGFRRTIGNHLQGLAFSLGLLLFVEAFMMRTFTATPRSGPRIEGTVALIGQEQMPVGRLIVIGVTVVVVVVTAFAMRRTWIGLALRACGDDEFAASTVGLPAKRVGLYAFVVAGVLAAVAGVCIALVVPITPLTGLAFLLKGFVVAIIGGLGSIEGTFVAAMMLGLLEALGTRYVEAGLTNAYGFVLMIVILLVAPAGLFNRRQVRAG
ncbi:branched-chain amino acid ABC transporter permease [Pseudonocardia sulfidoxydans NBRC 16205]|uniref:Branched-chain amino acid ABC transporter permease n=1 Tax=Pseudonocardia sulfidoxydans NBRC 16205 TaxID=1223511 RepID=A0A511DNG6_9PSEU|nr:branched-chain amino acid ABC transporter permease [Pseudonocardia sulfidoxydans]GEL25334.1 branched-chain amino acid ABC transporter permease [Pseudonocardia sulfidoxydans NBRC 16205]